MVAWLSKCVRILSAGGGRCGGSRGPEFPQGDSQFATRERLAHRANPTGLRAPGIRLDEIDRWTALDARTIDRGLEGLDRGLRDIAFVDSMIAAFHPGEMEVERGLSFHTDELASMPLLYRLI